MNVFVIILSFVAKESLLVHTFGRNQWLMKKLLLFLEISFVTFDEHATSLASLVMMILGFYKIEFTL